MHIESNQWFLAESTQHGRGDLAMIPPALGSWQLKAGVGFLARWCCCALLRTKGWGSCCLQAHAIHRTPGERLLRWQCQGTGPLPSGAWLRGGSRQGEACLGKLRQPAAPVSCLLLRWAGDKGQCRVGALQEGLCRGSPSGWVDATPAHRKPASN